MRANLGDTSVIRHVFIQDSTVTTGAGKTNLTNATSGISSYYIFPGGTKTALTLEDISSLGTYAAPTSNAHLRFKEIDATNMPGWYELQFHNDWFSSGNARKMAAVQIKGATGMAPLNCGIDITGVQQTGDSYAIVAHTDYGNAKLVRSTTPANTLDVSATGEAGLDFNNIKDATGAHTLTNITVPTATNLTNLPAIPTDWLAAGGVKADAVTKIQTGLATPTNITAASGVALSSTGADLILKSSTFIQAIVAAINEFATYGLTALNTLLVTTGIKATTIPNATVGGYAAGQDPATLVLVTPANKINTDASNAVKIQKMAVTLATGDVSGNLPAQVKAQDNIDFGALQKASLNAATPGVDVKKVNGVVLTGNGTTTPWGPA